MLPYNIHHVAIAVRDLEAAIAGYRAESCIRCGRCVEACPMGLLPGTIGMLSEKGHYDELEEHHIQDCVECGCCAFICPSFRPLVQMVRRGKAELREIQAQQKSEEAK